MDTHEHLGMQLADGVRYGDKLQVGWAFTLLLPFISFLGCDAPGVTPYSGLITATSACCYGEEPSDGHSCAHVITCVLYAPPPKPGCASQVWAFMCAWHVLAVPLPTLPGVPSDGAVLP